MVLVAMKANRKDNPGIGSPTTQEIGILKSYSNRTKEAYFKADPELWSEFKATCKLRGVSICHVLEALMQAWIEGQKVTSTLINPVVINLKMEHVVKRPRRESNIENSVFTARDKPWPPPCEKADKFIKSTKEVGCLDIKEWIPLKECWRCFIYNEGR